MLNLLNLALDERINTQTEKQVDSVKWSCRLVGYDNVVSMKELKAQIVGHLISLRGNIVRVSSAKPLLVQMAFSCANCQSETIEHFDDGKYRLPSKCSQIGCKSRSFVPLRESPQTITIDWQRIKLQEKLLVDSSLGGDGGDNSASGNSNQGAGRVPRSIDCEITGDMVDAVLPGDTVTLTGIVKFTQAKGSAGGGGGKNSGGAMHVLYIDAVSICKTTLTKSQQDVDGSLGYGGESSTSGEEAFLSSASSSSKDSVDFDYVDYYAIRDIHGQPDLFRLLVHSVAPSIFGHEVVKAGLLLALFGGRQRHLQQAHNGAETRVPIRSNSHVLVVGDPGMGKSQMLNFIANCAPRGVYVCSNTTTSSGLTVTLSKEAGSGEFALEAGALVLGDQGCCCIDEFDKLTEHEALLEAMEQQSVSIAKAGITCSLPARTSVLAAANPVGGHYNKAKTVSENLKMDTALLSRFDLIFILLDKPNEDMDRYLSEHVMRLHSNAASSRVSGNSAAIPSSNIALAQKGSPENQLYDYLISGRREVIDPLPAQLLRKYIAYSRKYVHPRLSQEASVVLQDFYLKLRANFRSLDTAPITTRQLESLIRLSEARARCELREMVTKKDAEDVVEIMKQSLYETCEDDEGHVEFQRSQMGVGMSKKNEVKRFIARLQQMFQQTSNVLFTHQQLYGIANSLGIKFDSFQTFLDNVNNHGYLIKKPNRTYKLCLSE